MSNWSNTFGGAIMIPTGSVTGSSVGMGMIFAKTDGKIYIKTSNGVESEAGASAGGGGGTKITYFTSSGTWTPESGMKYAEIIIIGGGSGGGGGSSIFSGNSGVGGGGGTGGQSRYYKVSGDNLSGNYTVTIGAGGNGGAGIPWYGYSAGGFSTANGTPGGTTSITGSNLFVRTSQWYGSQNAGQASWNMYPQTFVLGNTPYPYGVGYRKFYASNSHIQSVAPNPYPYDPVNYPNGFFPNPSAELGQPAAGATSGLSGVYNGQSFNGGSSQSPGILVNYLEITQTSVYSASLPSTAANTEAPTAYSNVLTDFTMIFGNNTVLTSSLYGLGGGGGAPGTPTLGNASKNGANGGLYGGGGGGGSIGIQAASGAGGNGAQGLVIIAEYM